MRRLRRRLAPTPVDAAFGIFLECERGAEDAHSWNDDSPLQQRRQLELQLQPRDMQQIGATLFTAAADDDVAGLDQKRQPRLDAETSFDRDRPRELVAEIARERLPQMIGKNRNRSHRDACGNQQSHNERDQNTQNAAPYACTLWLLAQ